MPFSAQNSGPRYCLIHLRQRKVENLEDLVRRANLSSFLLHHDILHLSFAHINLRYRGEFNQDCHKV